MSGANNYYRGMGNINPQPRQPLRGRNNHGGLRWGEMDKDTIISYGYGAGYYNMAPQPPHLPNPAR
jgi:DNA-directed RNA polymerase beta subunit